VKRKHHELEIWREAMDPVTDCYRLTAGFPSDERYGLTGQIRRAAASLSANIAEGAARQTTKKFIQFVHIARASLAELETHIEIARRLKLLANDAALDDHLDRLFAKLNRFLQSLKNRTKVPS
jgi:four helix bundle protein